MKNIVQKSFGVNLTVLYILGLYIPYTPTRLSTIYSYTMYFMLTYSVPILGTLYFIFEEEPQRIGANAFLVAEIFCHITKLLPFVKNGRGIKNCLNFLESPVFVVDKERQKIILDESVKICQRNSKVFLFSVIFGWICWVSTPVLLGEKRLPLDVWPLLNNANDTRIYISVYIFLSIGVAYSCVASGAIDPLLGGLFCLTSGYCKILKDDLLNLDDQVLESAFTEKRFLLKKRIEKCVKFHDGILSLVKQLEDCFSTVVFSQFLGSIPVICFCCFQLSDLSPTTFNFFSIASYLSVFLVQIYFYCYYGTLLYEESDTIANAIYMGNWYQYDVHSKKDLILIMERCKQPIIVTAGKILELSLVTFTVILRRSYSLLAVLKNQ